MIQPGQTSVRCKSVSARSPYIRFEGVVELCSRLWLVVAVRQRDKRKGSIQKWRSRLVDLEIRNHFEYTSPCIYHERYNCYGDETGLDRYLCETVRLRSIALEKICRLSARRNPVWLGHISILTSWCLWRFLRLWRVNNYVCVGYEVGRPWVDAWNVESSQTRPRF